MKRNQGVLPWKVWKRGLNLGEDEFPLWWCQVLLLMLSGISYSWYRYVVACFVLHPIHACTCHACSEARMLCIQTCIYEIPVSILCSAVLSIYNTSVLYTYTLTKCNDWSSYIYMINVNLDLHYDWDLISTMSRQPELYIFMYIACMYIYVCGICTPIATLCYTVLNIMGFATSAEGYCHVCLGNEEFLNPLQSIYS